HFAVMLDALAVERRLGESPLALVQIAFAGQQTFAEDDLRALQREALHEGGVPGDEDVPDLVGMSEEEDRLPAEAELRRVAEITAETGEELQRTVLQRAQVSAGEPALGSWRKLRHRGQSAEGRGQKRKPRVLLFLRLGMIIDSRRQ